MRKEVVRDMRESMAFFEKAKPIIGNMLGGELKRVEGSDNDVCRLLDMSCGIDYIQTYSNGRSYGIASRIQKCVGIPYNTFTVRKSRESGARTEYDKWISGKPNDLHPYCQMQAYTRRGEIVSLAIACINDITDFRKKGYAHENRTGADKVGQASFYVCSWR